jgi:hypothetical protein
MAGGDCPHITVTSQDRKPCAANVLRNFLPQNSIVPTLTPLCDADHTACCRRHRIIKCCFIEFPE